MLCTVVYNTKSGAQCGKWSTNASWTYKVVHKCPGGQTQTDRRETLTNAIKYILLIKAKSNQSVQVMKH